MSGRSLKVGSISVRPLPAHPAATKIILLIHGFNNTEADAEKSYALLKEKLVEAGVNPVSLENTWNVYWPGFEPRRVNLLPSDQHALWYSVLTYRRQVPKAIAAGRLLGEYLSELPSKSSILVVAHSLGCRVALEAFREMTKNKCGSRVVAFCLMAAAVPTRMADTNGTLNEAAMLGKSIILWSRWDGVLRNAFPAGQALAHEGNSIAVGLTGQPALVWTARHQTDLGHSGYYRKASDHHYLFHASKDTWPYLAPLFGCVADKSLTEIQLAPWHGPQAHRPLSATLPEREVPSAVSKLWRVFF